MSRALKLSELISSDAGTLARDKYGVTYFKCAPENEGEVSEFWADNCLNVHHSKDIVSKRLVRIS